MFMFATLLRVSKKLFYNKKICPKNLRNRKKQPIFALAFQIEYDSVAQLVEHIPFKDGVLGSSPSWITVGAQESAPIFFEKYERKGI